MYSFPLQIEYSKKRKRSVALKITKEGVVVQAPFYYSEKKIHELVEKRKSWIEKNWAKVQVKKERDTKQFFEGSTLPYLGKRIPLTLRIWTKKSIKFGKNETQFVAYTNKERTQEDFLRYFERWEKSHAIWLLEEKTRVLGHKNGLIPEQIFIKKYTGKYAMCKGKDVYFDFKIIELPEAIIEHIILHELTHLVHKHHKTNFRKRLATMDSNWKKNRDFLRGKLD